MILFGTDLIVKEDCGCKTQQTIQTSVLICL